MECQRQWRARNFALGNLNLHIPFWVGRSPRSPNAFWFMLRQKTFHFIKHTKTEDSKKIDITSRFLQITRRILSGTTPDLGWRRKPGMPRNSWLRVVLTARSLKPISHLRFDYDTTTIRRYHDAFDYDGSDRNYNLRSIRLRYDYDMTTTKNWHVHFLLASNWSRRARYVVVRS